MTSFHRFIIEMFINEMYYVINRMDRINRISKIYKQKNIYLKMKKRADVTIDSEVHEIIEKIRSKEKFNPPFSQVLNSLLRESPEIKKKLKKK